MLCRFMLKLPYIAKVFVAVQLKYLVDEFFFEIKHGFFHLSLAGLNEGINAHDITSGI